VDFPVVLSNLPDCPSKTGIYKLVSGAVKLNMLDQIPKKQESPVLKQFIQERFDKEDPGDSRQDCGRQQRTIAATIHFRYSYTLLGLLISPIEDSLFFAPRVLYLSLYTLVNCGRSGT
jgi:hypothetical protein